jgi:hypothetical protein
MHSTDPRLRKMNIVPWERVRPLPGAEPAPKPARKPKRKPVLFTSNFPKLPIYDLMHAIAEETGVPMEFIVGPLRTPEVRDARWRFWYEAYMTGNYSMTRLGEVTSGRDHTTVRNGLQKYARANRLPLPGYEPRKP